MSDRSECGKQAAPQPPFVRFCSTHVAWSRPSERRQRPYALLVVLLVWAQAMLGQTAFIGPDAYAFQYQPGASPTLVGLFFNSTQAQYEFRDLAGAVELAINPIQQRSFFRGEVGLNVALPEAQLHVNGDARVGNGTDHLDVDAAGNLRFAGGAGYRVASNAYAFQADGSLAGLLFNVLENEFQFIDGSGNAVFAVTATGGTAGATRIEEDLAVNGNLAVGPANPLARLSANSTGGAQRAAVRGEGINDQTFGYLGVVGEASFDGTSLDLAGDEVGALGIALGGSPSSDNIGVQGYADGVGVRAANSNGLRVDLASADYAMESFGNARINGLLEVDSSQLTAVFIDNNRDFTAASVAPLLIGAESGNRLGLYKDAVQAASASSFARLDLNPLGGDVYLADGGGDVNLANGGAGNVNIALGGGAVNLASLLFTDPASARAAIGDPTPDYTFAVQHPIGTGLGNGLGIINALSATSWSMYSFISGDLGLFEGDSLKGRFDNVSGNYTVTSDRRLKSDIEDLDGASEALLALRPRAYRFKADATGQRRYYGFVAQELQEVLPDVVHQESETGLLSVSYTELIPLLVAGYQETKEQQEAVFEQQQDRIKSQEADIHALQRALERTQQQLLALEARLDAVAAPNQVPVPSSNPPSNASGGSIRSLTPNPSSGLCRVAFRLDAPLLQTRLEAYDQQGRLWTQKALPLEQDGSVLLVTSDWPQGVYHLRLIGEGRVLDTATLQVKR